MKKYVKLVISKNYNEMHGQQNIKTNVTVTLVMQYARVLLTSVACPDLPYFSHYLINGTIFGNKLFNIKSVFLFSLQHLSKTILILRRNERDMIKNVYWSSCKYPLFLSDFNETRSFTADFRKIFKHQIS
jgi:hypothetical protein